MRKFNRQFFALICLGAIFAAFLVPMLVGGMIDGVWTLYRLERDFWNEVIVP